MAKIEPVAQNNDHDGARPHLTAVEGFADESPVKRRRWFIAFGVILVSGLSWFGFERFFRRAGDVAQSAAPLAEGPLKLLSPEHKQQLWLRAEDTVSLEWSGPAPVDLELASDRGFKNIIARATDAKSPFILTGLKLDSTYFWRIIPKGAAPQNAPSTTEGAHEFFAGSKSAPAPIYPPSGAETPLRKAIVAWRQKPHVETYRVQIAMDHKFNDVVRDLTVGGGNRYQLSELPPGKYYWRVSSRDHKALKNLWSEGRALTISHDRRPAAFDDSN